MKAGWEVRPLGQVCRLINGRAYKQAELLEAGPYPVLRVGNFFTNNHWYYSDFELEADKYCEDGDLLYAWSASFGPRIWRGGKAIYHYHIWKVSPDASRLDRDFLYYFFDWDKELIKKEQGAGTTMIHVSKGSMEARNIPLPPLDEQKRIVAVLDEAFEGLDRARANAEVNLSDARELAEGLASAAFEAHSGDWSEAPLGELAQFRNGLNFTRSSKGRSIKIVGVGDFQKNQEVPVASLSEVVIDGALADEDRLRVGDILAVRSNGNKALIGRVMMVPETPEIISFSGFTIRIRLESGALLPEYLLQFMKTPSVRATLTAGGGGSNISNLNQGQLSRLRIRFPSIDRQRDILNKVAGANEAIRELQENMQVQHSALTTLRQSLLQKAFSGELT